LKKSAPSGSTIEVHVFDLDVEVLVNRVTIDTFDPAAFKNKLHVCFLHDHNLHIDIMNV
jgi:hypothetical protein